MKNNPFEIISYWLSQQGLTSIEKRQMKQTLLSYVADHPVKSHFLSPFTLKFASVAFASLLIVLGGSIGVTSASMRSLPNQSLYPLKLWIEEFQSNRTSDPAKQMAWETKRIATRFDEATKLATTQSLDESTARMIQSGIEHSQSKIKLLASDLEKTEPTLALAAASTLEATISSSGKLLARIEQTSGQNVQTIVLAAEVSTKKLALEKVSLEKLVALQPNNTTKDMVMKRYAELKELIPIPEPVPSATTLSSISEPDAVTSGEPVTTPEEPEPIPVVSEHNALIELMIEIEAKIQEEEYSEALVLIKKVDQLLQEAAQTKKLEDAYDIPALPTPTEPAPVLEEEADPNSVEILIPAENKIQKLPVSEKTSVRKAV